MDASTSGRAAVVKTKKPRITAAQIKEKTLARLRKDSIITLEKEGKELPKGARLMHLGWPDVRDTYWSHTDPMKTLSNMTRYTKIQLAEDVIHSSGLATAALIPFAVPFPELCFEVAWWSNIAQRALFGLNGEKILDFSPEGIERAFAWTSDGVEYTEAESLSFAVKCRAPGKAQKEWMFPECKEWMGQ